MTIERLDTDFKLPFEEAVFTSEDPAQIAFEVESGFREMGAGDYRIVIDRKDAIREAIAAARCGDIVNIAGKGHETYQVLRDTVVPFDAC